MICKQVGHRTQTLRLKFMSLILIYVISISKYQSSATMKFLSFMIMVAYILVSSLRISIANDSMNVLQSMSDGVSLVSKGGKFEFGYSHKRYVGIWYKNIPIQTVVWVANKANPINDSSGIITLNNTGNLVLTQNAYLVWYTNNSHKQAQNPVVVLLDSGNLVIKNEEETDPEVCLWQSFDYPSDTLLPGMKLERNIRTGHEWKLTSWKNPNDPSPGDIYRVLELYNYPELYVMKGKKKVYRSGPWNGLYFSGLPYLQNNTIFGYNFVSNKDEIYFTTVVNQTGIVYRYVWLEGDHNWTMHRSYPKEFCDNYGLCGAYGNCIINQAQGCQCLKGFSPKSPQAWASSDWSQGCVRNKPLSCNGEHKDGFVKFEGLKVPDTTQTWLDKTIGLEECRVKCLNNCSCMAYSNSDIRGAGSGCVMWYGDLIDIRQFETGGQGLHIRMSASESEPEDGHERNTPTIVASTIAAICGALLISSYFICRNRRNNAVTNYSKDKSEKDIDLPTFDFSFISNATNDFSQSEKLGQGGFGSVYKGILPDGQEIAVKRLSKTSGQGLDEFKNEVMLIAKLQHRNLVKLLGCSIQQDEKLILIWKMNFDLWLPRHFQAWRLWIEKRPTELMDDLVDNSACPSEIIRYIHIGLLCVQQRPEDRPNMSSVTLFLNGEKLLPEPNQPGFYTGKAHPTKPNSSSRNIDVYSFNEMSNSLLEPSS
ncbi:G-type lectin S-receptor-like serine/threonine-protein kinase [Glycine max]|nr:G-type lectin S-receptor-like serine/threonine-protein kinase [Glycine max]